MKCILFLALSASVAGAADFNTGQAARAVVGQPQYTRQDATPTASIIGGASGVANANNTLFVADSTRVGAFHHDDIADIVVPGVLRDFDLPDIVTALGPRYTR